MIKKIHFIFFTLLAFIVNAQENYNDKEFEVVLSDLTTRTYSSDSTEGAVVIYELGKSYIKDPNFDLTFTMKRKIKILTKKGFEKANVVLSLFNDGNREESVQNIRATTYNLVDGKIINSELKEGDIIKEKSSKNRTLYKFAMPSVKEGSVITYSYQIKSPFLYEFKTWYFQSDIPKIHSEYHTSIPGNYQYYIRLNGDLELNSINEEVRPNCVKGGRGTSADCFDAQYIMKNVPRFAGESFMPSHENYLSKLDYQLGSIIGFDGSSKYFRRIDERLKESKGGGQMNKRKLVKNLISNELISKTKTLDKVKQIYSFVQDSYSWNGDYGVSKNNSLKELIHTKSGNVVEINLLLHNLLQEYGIDSSPVILSTRENGRIDRKRPKDSDFNYLIVRATLNGEHFLLDASDKHLSFNQLPFQCLNQIGFLLDFEHGSKWIPIKTSEPAIKEYKLELNADSGGDFYGKVEISRIGQFALQARKKYFSSTSKSYLERELYGTLDIELEQNEITPQFNKGSEFKELYDIRYTPEIVGENVYVNPFLFTLANESFDSNKRKYPVDFGYRRIERYTLNINLDGNFTIVNLPKNSLFEMPNQMGKAELTCERTKDSIILGFKFSFNKEIYSPDDYSDFRKYVNTINNIQNTTSIILKKH